MACSNRKIISQGHPEEFFWCLIGQNCVTWLHTAAREAGKVSGIMSLYCGSWKEWEINVFWVALTQQCAIPVLSGSIVHYLYHYPMLCSIIGRQKLLGSPFNFIFVSSIWWCELACPFIPLHLPRERPLDNWWPKENEEAQGANLNSRLLMSKKK